MEKDVKDILIDVLKVGELASRVVCRPNLHAPWGLKFDPKNQVMFITLNKSLVCFMKIKMLNPSLYIKMIWFLFIKDIAIKYVLTFFFVTS